MEIQVGSSSTAVTIFFVIFGLVAANLLYRVIKNRGFKGAMFGAPVSRQVAEMELSSRGIVKTKLKVHLLSPRDPGEGPHVGVEVIQSTIGSWEMKPVALTRMEAKELADELARAADSSVSATSGTAG